ncbi:MAG TPA: peptidyl-tRNA hydrolase, partial [Rectinemataceae bacterium]|nr:peptidyl-tRNA hydrolase [Rectinemataceae bacterium]
LGIGRPNHDDIAGYVLSDFKKEEKEILAVSVFPRAGQALGECIEIGFDDVKDKYKKINCL